MNPMQKKTPEERRASAAKGIETRRRNKAERAAEQRASYDMRDALKSEIRELTERLGCLRRPEAANDVAIELTGVSLLTAGEIVAAKMPWHKLTGVYFLIKGDTVVYVGQAVNVPARINAHAAVKDFDSFAFVRCTAEALDKLESLYIYCLRPVLNGDSPNGAKLAPVRLSTLIGNHLGT